jgi:hypothetical protein
MSAPVTLRASLPGLPSSPNRKSRGWRARAAETKRWRRDAASVCLVLPALQPTEGVTLTLTRCRTRGPGLDYDNLVASFKAALDGICDVLWKDCTRHARRPCGPYHDADERLRVVYEQQAAGQTCVRICVVIEDMEVAA